MYKVGRSQIRHLKRDDKLRKMANKSKIIHATVILQPLDKCPEVLKQRQWSWLKLQLTRSKILKASRMKCLAQTREWRYSKVALKFEQSTPLIYTKPLEYGTRAGILNHETAWMTDPAGSYLSVTHPKSRDETPPDTQTRIVNCKWAVLSDFSIVLSLSHALWIIRRLRISGIDVTL